MLCNGLDCEIRFEGQGAETIFHELKSDRLEKRLSEDLFKSIIACKDGHPYLQFIGVPWYKVGGPEPYHDSATIEIYGPHDMQAAFAGRIQKYFFENKSELEIIEGLPHLRDSSGWWNGKRIRKIAKGARKLKAILGAACGFGSSIGRRRKR
jgi:hypothetical protein